MEKKKKSVRHEACELYIEQEIAEGLEKGETPYYIGKTLSDWISELFDAKINPKTLETKARRQKKKTSNEGKESKVTEDQILTDAPKLVESGGKRDGAGRPKKTTSTPSIDDFVLGLIKEMGLLDNKLYKLIGNTQSIESKMLKDNLVLKLKTVTNTINKLIEEI